MNYFPFAEKKHTSVVCLPGCNMLESFCKILKKKIKCCTAQPATSHILPNKAFVSMIKMSNPVLLPMLNPVFSIVIHHVEASNLI